MNYELTLEAYQGPLDKLLELVEAKKMEVTEISLAEVTADFLDYLKKLEAENVSQTLLADFLVIASKLIFIKSKILLPSLFAGEEETEKEASVPLPFRAFPAQPDVAERHTHIPDKSGRPGILHRVSG